MNSFHFMISKLNNVFREDFLVFLISVWYSASTNDTDFINPWNTFYCHFWFFAFVLSLLTFHSWLFTLELSFWLVTLELSSIATFDLSLLTIHPCVIALELPLVTCHFWFFNLVLSLLLVFLDLSLVICHSGHAALDFSILTCHFCLVTLDLPLLTCQSSLFKLCWNFWRYLTSIWIFSFFTWSMIIPFNCVLNKLGLKWTKLSSNWNWALLWLRFAKLHWWLPTNYHYISWAQ